jgi:N-acetylglucosaminyldiphosphoundecaprenol N-acetyl-beta-D-mannosaminyltransferase
MIREDLRILGSRVDPTSYEAATSLVLAWAHREESRAVCAANVHMIMEAYDSQEFQKMVNAADLVTPDGMPLVWVLRHLGYPQQPRVYGPELTLKVVEAAAVQGVSVGFYGSTPEVLERLTAKFQRLFPALRLAYSFSPPFRPLTLEEDRLIVNEINSSGARLLFVGLGCPHQERWVAEHKRQVQAVMLAVGAAFDFHAGLKLQAPRWMQAAGLEWFFRLMQEPVRLWRRYLYHNPRFVLLVLQELLFKRFSRQD